MTAIDRGETGQAARSGKPIAAGRAAAAILLALAGIGAVDGAALAQSAAGAKPDPGQLQRIMRTMGEQSPIPDSAVTDFPGLSGTEDRFASEVLQVRPDIAERIARSFPQMSPTQKRRYVEGLQHYVFDEASIANKIGNQARLAAAGRVYLACDAMLAALARAQRVLEQPAHDR